MNTTDDPKLNFLLIEDDYDYAAYLMVIIRGVFGAGSEIRRVEALDEALSEIESGIYDVCFVDYQLEGFTGLDVLGALAVDDTETAFIFLTNFSRMEIAAEAMQCGAADYLIKAKFDEFELQRCVNFALYQKRKGLELRKAALRDPLTGVANRALFDDRFASALRRAERRHDRVGVLYIDIDGFKPINDTHGHDVGDLLLQEFARRIGEHTRRSDTLARLGGDEFAVILDGLEDTASIPNILVPIEDALAEPYILAGMSITIGASIGSAIYPEDSDEGETLLKMADQRMYAAKQEKYGARATRVSHG